MDVLGFQTLNMFIPSSTTLERRKVKKKEKEEEETENKKVHKAKGK